MLPIFPNHIFYYKTFIGSNDVSSCLGIYVRQFSDSNLCERSPSGWRFQQTIALLSLDITVKQIVKLLSPALIPPAKTGANTVCLNWRPFSHLGNAS